MTDLATESDDQGEKQVSEVVMALSHPCVVRLSVPVHQRRRRHPGSREMHEKKDLNVTKPQGAFIDDSTSVTRQKESRLSRRFQVRMRIFKSRYPTRLLCGRVSDVQKDFVGLLR